MPTLIPSYKGKASSTRMFNHLKRHSINPSGGIYMFIKVTQPPPVPVTAPTKPPRLQTGGSTYDYTFTGTGTLTRSIVYAAQIGTAESVYIEGYTTIDNLTFYDTTLTSVTIGNSVTSIGQQVFLLCSSLLSVKIGNSVTSIGSNSFQGCSGLTSITIPNSVTSIGQSAFQLCSSLTSITIPNSVTSIGNYAFYQCTLLTSINVDTSNTIYSSLDGVLFNELQTTLIQFPTGKNVSSYTIPDSVTSIGNYAFQGCSGLLSVTIPNSVTSIGTNAFQKCTGLTSITIPDSVTSIGQQAFSDCTSLTSIAIPNSVTSIGTDAFLDSALTTVTISFATGAALTPAIPVPATNVSFFGVTVATILP